MYETAFYVTRHVLATLTALERLVSKSRLSNMMSLTDEQSYTREWVCAPCATQVSYSCRMSRTFEKRAKTVGYFLCNTASEF